MALPKGYKDFETYIEDSLALLKEYSWIYNAPNTHLLSSKALQETSPDWIDYFVRISNKNLNKLTAGEVQENAPKTLKEFFKKVKSLSTTFDRYANEVVIDFPKNAPIALKKKHEIVSLIPLVNDICKKTNCQTVFDFGCGVGYISQILHQQFHYKVIGIEGHKKKVTLAEQYQKKFYENTSDKVQFVEHFVTDASLNFLNGLYETKLTSRENVCIIGLHVCADLCVTVLDLFQQLDFVKGLVIMPCCYHRMVVYEANDSTESFAKFPCSKIFRRKYADMEGSQFLRRTFLRIAAQRSNENWKDLKREEHEFRAKNCLFRAIVEEIVREENWKIKRLKRKSGLRTVAFYDVNLAIENLKDTHLLTAQNDEHIDHAIIKEKVFEKWKIYKDQYLVIESIIVLQNALQSMCENLVLLDRIEYLKEKGIDGFVCKVTDDVISPRCYAIVATKS